MDTEMRGDGRTGQVEGEAHGLLDEAKERGTEIGRQVKNEADHVMGELRVRARDESNEQARRAAGALRGVAQQLGDMAQGTGGQGKVIDLTREGAQQIERFAERLDRDGMDGILRDLQTFARRRPAAFLAAGFGLGMVIGRLVRSSDLGQSNGADQGLRHGGEGHYLSPGVMGQESLAAGSSFDSGTSIGRLPEVEGDRPGNGEILGKAKRADGFEDRTE